LHDEIDFNAVDEQGESNVYDLAIVQSFYGTDKLRIKSAVDAVT